MFTLINSKKNNAHFNMKMDMDLLLSMKTDPKAVLHLYDWEKPSITHGIFLNPESFLSMKALERNQIDLAKRPTGGGITLHLSDLAFSLILPKKHPFYLVNTLACYLIVNEKVVEAFNQFFGKKMAFSFHPVEVKMDNAMQHFCMAKPTKYDVMFRGKKIGGAAQRKTKWGLLHQGTISLGLVEEQLLDELLLQKEVAQAIMNRSFAPLGHSWSEKDLKEARREMQLALKQVFCNE